MNTTLDSLRLALMVAGTTAAALSAAHAVLTLAIIAATVAITIGLYELTHRN